MSEVNVQDAKCGTTEGGTAEPAAPNPELVEQFGRLEGMIDEAVRLIADLKRRNRELDARLAEDAQSRAEAVKRIDALLDKIDGLL